MFSITISEGHDSDSVLLKIEANEKLSYKHVYMDLHQANVHTSIGHFGSQVTLLTWRHEGKPSVLSIEQYKGGLAINTNGVLFIIK